MFLVELDNIQRGHTIWNQCKQIPISMEYMRIHYIIHSQQISTDDAEKRVNGRLCVCRSSVVRVCI